MPKGISDYNALNVQLEGRGGAVNKKDLTWIKGNQLTLTYTLSRLTGDVRAGIIGRPAEIGAFAFAWDNNNLDGSAFRGPMGLDRTDMFNIATVTEIKGGFRFSQIRSSVERISSEHFTANGPRSRRTCRNVKVRTVVLVDRRRSSAQM